MTVLLLIPLTVVHHHGKNATGGHYTCDVLRESGCWLDFDDSDVEEIPSSQVTGKMDGSEYLLFYHRK